MKRKQKAKHRVVCTATIMRVGWEMDNKAWIVERKDGSRELLSTSHGGTCSLSIRQLDEYIKETEGSLEELKTLKKIWCEQ